MKKIILLPVMILLTLQCAGQKKTASPLPETTSEAVNRTYPQKAPEKGTVRLKESENVFLKEEQLNLTFLRMVEDKRCPMEVKCIKAGDATVEIEVMGLYTRPRVFAVSQNKTNGKESFVFAGRKFTLQGIYPAKSMHLKPEDMQGKYVIDVKIEATSR